MFGFRKTYKYLLAEEYTCKVSAKDGEYPYCTVLDGVLTIKRGYAWNGCTPNLSFLGLVQVGTPDGHNDYLTDKPLAYYASLVHDCRCQYQVGTRADADKQFKRKLKAVGFPLATAYYMAVRLFGKEWEREG